MNENIINYIESVNTIYQTGETTEHSFRGSLEELVKSMLPKAKKNDTPINVINEPKRKEYGAPDFELRKGEVIISFIETKDLFDKDLRGQNDKAHKEQCSHSCGSIWGFYQRDRHFRFCPSAFQGYRSRREQSQRRL